MFPFWGAHASSVLVGKPGRSSTRVTAGSCRNELVLGSTRALACHVRCPRRTPCLSAQRAHFRPGPLSQHGVARSQTSLTFLNNRAAFIMQIAFQKRLLPFAFSLLLTT